MVNAAIDIHKRIFQAAVLDAESGELRQERLPATREALADWAARWQGKLEAVALEATTGCRWVARELQTPGVDVRLCDPGEARALGGSKRRPKTDRLDTGLARAAFGEGDAARGLAAPGGDPVPPRPHPPAARARQGPQPLGAAAARPAHPRGLALRPRPAAGRLRPAVGTRARPAYARPCERRGDARRDRRARRADRAPRPRAAPARPQRRAPAGALRHLRCRARAGGPHPRRTRRRPSLPPRPPGRVPQRPRPGRRRIRQRAPRAAGSPSKARPSSAVPWPRPPTTPANGAPDHDLYRAVKDRRGGQRTTLTVARKIARRAYHTLNELEQAA